MLDRDRVWVLLLCVIALAVSATAARAVPIEGGVADDPADCDWRWVCR
jgi:hypothetical protein